MKNHLEIHRSVEHSVEWHLARSKGIGGSDIGSILGLNPYKASIQLYHEKIGTWNPFIEENQAIFHGNHLEEYIGKLWEYYSQEDGYISNYNAEKKIRRCRRVGGAIINPKYPWLVANTDRVMNKGSANLLTGEVMKEEHPLEIKTISHWAMKAWEDGVPAYHVAQVMHYMIVMEVDYGEIAVLKDGRDFHVYPIELDPQVKDLIIMESHDFWMNKVVPGRKYVKDRKRAELAADKKAVEAFEAKIVELEPEPDESEAYKNFLSNRELTDPDQMDGEMEDYDLAKQIKFIQAVKKKLDRAEVLRKNTLLKKMTDNNIDKLNFDEMGYLDAKRRKGSDKLTFNVRIKSKPEDSEVAKQVDGLDFRY